MTNINLFYLVISLIILRFSVIGFDIGSSMNDHLSEEDRIFYGFIDEKGKK